MSGGERKINWHKRLEALLSDLGENTSDSAPRLLLHCCCAPCASASLGCLSKYFRITLLFYNPNISPREEFEKRAAELSRLAGELPLFSPVSVVKDSYDPEEFFRAVKGLENIPEGGGRCFACYRLRLERAARYAAENGFDYFCSTLSTGPMKNADKLNEIGGELSQIYSVAHLPNDFKKNDGYRRSVELSREYGLYRQDYCGCVFSRREAEQRRRERSRQPDSAE